MTVGDTIRARFRTLPNSDAGERATFEEKFPLREAVVIYIHSAGRYVTLETVLDGKSVRESFRPEELKERRQK